MITHIKGDATEILETDKPVIIAHIVNDIGVWGSGFVLAVSKKWPHVRDEYLKSFELKINFELGNNQYVKAEKDIYIANMIAQRSIISKSKIPPIKYDALEKSLLDLNKKTKELKATIYMPKIGSGLAGGDWDKIETIIASSVKDVNVKIFSLV